ncbi:hypothetical protein [Paraflavitalea pollutisoli]|uniref:hypothetical protein n=1 Tax=Paraflavitalea pollutisoli TaxID=3034143 RepID=UPI0023EBA1F2|nr:hypothetical protein [Paraflavitalea sp. H1-2-19X]
MSINESTAAAALETLYAPIAPPGYGLWFTGEYKDIVIEESTIKHRKEAIEAYYAGYTAAYNIVKGKSYACKFEWSQSPSAQPSCLCYTLYVFVTPPPSIALEKSKADMVAMEFADGDGDGQIDPPKPPPPPPPHL